MGIAAATLIRGMIMFCFRMNSGFSRIVGIAMKFHVAVMMLVLAAGEVCGEISIISRALPGIVIHSETRTNPPQRLFVAEIDLTNPALQLRVAPGGDDPDGEGKWETTLMHPTRIAERENFALVVNGDFYEVPRPENTGASKALYRISSWAAVSGPAASAGKVWSTSSEARPCLVVDKDGKVSIQNLREPRPNDLEVVSGNVMLVHDGKIVSHANKQRHPRTAVGLNRDATRLVLLVVDGRKPGVAMGMTYEELASEFLRLGCHEALNLDGGGSSVMAVRDGAGQGLRILNEPTDGRERPVANVLGISVRPHSKN